MASTKQAITSLLTEHFRYTPLTLLDDIINTVNELVYRAVTAVEEGLTSTSAASLGFAERARDEKRDPSQPSTSDSADRTSSSDGLYPESRLEIEHGVHQLETLLEATVDKNFDKLEIFVLRSILSVPEELVQWLQMRHYENLDFTPDPSSTSLATPQSLHLLRRKLHETRKLNMALRTEEARNAALIQQLRSVMQTPSSQAQAQASVSLNADNTTRTQDGSLAFLTNQQSGQARGGRQLTPQTQALLPHLTTLRHLLATLSSRLPSTTSIPPTIPSENTTSVVTAHAEERRRYIESQTRRTVDRAGAADDDAQGGSLGSIFPGGKVGPEEVRGIESVVKALGVGEEEGERMDVD